MFDYKNWMGCLPQNLHHIPICFLAIPGTHDSFSYSLSRNSDISPDAPSIAKVLNKLFGPLLRYIVYNWGRTQLDDVVKQLDIGIRYYDIRVAVKPKENVIYSCHGMYGLRLEDALVDIDTFLTSHEKETVVLDIQHFYNFKTNDHAYLTATLKAIFKDKLCPPQTSLTKVTLHWLWRHKYQVIVIYRNEYVKNTAFWPSIKWITWWPDTTNVEKLCSFLDSSLKHRPPNAGFVSQCVLTPTVRFIVRHLLSTLEYTCAIPCNTIVTDDWLLKQKSGSIRGINVIIADFVTAEHFKFCPIVIQKNYNLSYRLRIGGNYLPN